MWRECLISFSTENVQSENLSSYVEMKNLNSKTDKGFSKKYLCSVKHVLLAERQRFQFNWIIFFLNFIYKSFSNAF